MMATDTPEKDQLKQKKIQVKTRSIQNIRRTGEYNAGI